MLLGDARGDRARYLFQQELALIARLWRIVRAGPAVSGFVRSSVNLKSIVAVCPAATLTRCCADTTPVPVTRTV